MEQPANIAGEPPPGAERAVLGSVAERGGGGALAKTLYKQLEPANILQSDLKLPFPSARWPFQPDPDKPRAMGRAPQGGLLRMPQRKKRELWKKTGLIQPEDLPSWHWAALGERGEEAGQSAAGREEQSGPGPQTLATEGPTAGGGGGGAWNWRKLGAVTGGVFCPPGRQAGRQRRVGVGSPGDMRLRGLESRPRQGSPAC